MPHASWGDRTVAQLSIIGRAFGQSVVNVFHFQAEPTLEATFLTDDIARSATETLLEDWQTNLMSPWRGCHNGEYSVLMLRAQVLERPSNYEHRLTPTEVAITSGGAGLDAGNAVNATGSGVIRWRTARAGKRYRGRSYVGPVTSSWSENGVLTSDYITLLNTFGNAMKTRYGAGGLPADTWVQTIYSRPFDQGDYGYPQGTHPNRVFFYPDAYAGDATNVTDFAIDTTLRSQRRRQIGVGS
jgi:hypothetical protein